MEWTDPEIELVRQLLPTVSVKSLMQLLPGRSEKAIRNLAASHGLKRQVPANWRPIGAERMDRGYLIRKVTDTGNPKKDWKRVDVIEWETIHGPVPPGMVLVQERNPTTLQVDLVPVPRDQQLIKSRFETRHPLGKERVRHGVLQRKVAETGDRHDDWKRVDVILWESAHGPVPLDKVVMAIDNTKPRTLDNLALYSREEHMLRVSVNNLPPELRQIVQLKGQITQVINRRKKEEAQ
ncbi:HNH endonuclease [Acidovorax sp. LjRoot74]|uniref:hypothetical protein n=1 Tax=Acidovorax sp. LjRoot74 TaxID=3342337 RepID=UPI003ECDB049